MAIWEERRHRRTIVLTVLLTATLVVGVFLLVSTGLRLAEALKAPRRVAVVLPTAEPSPTPTETLAPTATATLTATATPSPLPTTVPSVTLTPAPACVEGIGGGSFEVGDTWAIVSTAYVAGYASRPATYVTNPVRSGLKSLRLGIVDGQDVFSYSAAEQWVTIPADGAAARLSVWLYLVTTDRTGDAQYVLIVKETGGYDILMGVLANDDGWQRREFSLDAYRGQRIAVHFEVRNDGDGSLTAMYVDDVALALCPLVTPTPLPKTS